MKVRKDEVTDFRPINLTITFETKEEIGAFRALFNIHDICHFLRRYGVRPEDIRESLPHISDQYWRELSRSI